MIILAIINFLVNLEYSIVNAFFSNTIPTFNALTTWITHVSVPQTIYNFFAITTYFLPMGTISILLGFTIAIIWFKIFTAILHMLSFGKIF